MKEHTINLGGEEKPLEYRLRDRLEIERQFRKADGTPIGLLGLLREIDPTGSLEVFAFILWVGLRRADKKLTYEKTLDLLDERFAEGLEMRQLVKTVFNPVFNAIGESRVLGLNISLELREDDEPERGKVLRPIRAASEY